MPALVPGDIVQAIVKYSFPESSVMQNVFHFLINGPAGSEADDAYAVSALLERLETCWDNIVTHMSTSLSVLEVAWDTVEWVGDKWTWFRHVGDSILDIVPSSALDLLPPGNCGLLEFIPIYPKSTGRKYLGGFTEEAIAPDGALSSTAGAHLMLFGEDLTSTTVVLPGVPSNLEGQYVILNRMFGTYNLPIAVGLNENVSYQRRRKQYVGS